MSMDDTDWPSRWSHVHKYLNRSGPFAAEGFEPCEELVDFYHACPLLVIGAGGLGCELLKNLGLLGFKNIHVIDMDTIDLSNLNRQFLFRESDIGKSKAIVAAEFISKRIPGCVVTPYYGKIQDKDDDYYEQFPLIICGLDSVEARRWINAKIVSMYDQDDPASQKPIIDGGTEGFKGQARVIIPKVTACYECSLDMQTKPKSFPVCTIANTPRLPEHCIEWASQLEWPVKFPDQKLDGDDPEHITWVMKMAQKRGDQHNINGITYSLTQGVVKNIIPAIASTNALVAASCATEAFKLITNCARHLNNYMMYVGDYGVYTYTFSLEKKDDCPICGSTKITVNVSETTTLGDLLEILADDPQMYLELN